MLLQLQSVVVVGGSVELKASQYATAKLRQAFSLYEGAMDPVRECRYSLAVVDDPVRVSYFVILLVAVGSSGGQEDMGRGQTCRGARWCASVAVQMPTVPGPLDEAICHGGTRLGCIYYWHDSDGTSERLFT